MTLSLAEWHDRYRRQAGWTRQLRLQLVSQLKLDHTSRILDMGCGTGALFSDLQRLQPGTVYGLDLDLAALRFAADRTGGVLLTAGDGRWLPFPDHVFELAYCHFTLMWIPSPAHVLQEMARVVKPGGMVGVLAEPDYGGRIDYPPPLDRIRALQIRALESQGADPLLGRKLPSLLEKADLTGTHTGVYQGSWMGTPDPEALLREWDMLAHDLGAAVNPAELDNLHRADREARAEGSRMIFVPTFYGWGHVRPPAK